MDEASVSFTIDFVFYGLFSVLFPSSPHAPDEVEPPPRSRQRLRDGDAQPAPRGRSVDGDSDTLVSRIGEQHHRSPGY